MVKYKYIHFVVIKELKKTKIYGCYNNNSSEKLGEVKWYGPWRQYCYFPTVQAIYSTGCLNDINDFINKLKQ